MRIAVPTVASPGGGLPAVAYGPDSQAILDAHRNFWTMFLPQLLEDPGSDQVAATNLGALTQCWEEISTTLTSLADGADLLFTGVNFEDAAANVAEYYDIPLATLHYFPMRPNGQLVPILPAPLGRSAMTVFDWLAWRGAKKLEDAQRRELGLPKATRSLAATDHRARIAGNPGLRRGLLSRAGSRMGEMGWSTALCRRADDGVADGCR